MNLRRLITTSISEAVSALSVFNKPRLGGRILMYHAIGTKVVDDRFGIFSLKPDDFRQQIVLLSRCKDVHVVGFPETAQVGDSSSVAITFDDGYQDNLDIAAPILLEFGFPFTVFVSSDFVRNRKATFLSPSNLRVLAGLPGVHIGAHGARHVDLTKCTDEILRMELYNSKRYLEDLLGFEVSSLSYPYGAVDRRVRDFAQEAGYRIGASSFAGINRSGSDPLLLARTEITGLDANRVFLQKLQGHWDWYRWRQRDPASI